ncbi:MAG: formyltetrahydrofolate deformylase [Verrucomicrobiales bacterium]|nr:formyltetrahydrofolate deformylase [Verrucomicrobiales bacterium]
MRNPVLLVSCADQRGLVHATTGVLLRAGANVVSNQEFVDGETNRFFMRTEFEGATDCARIEADVRAVLPAGAVVCARQPARRRVAILVSKEHHCLADLLVRHAYGELFAEVVAVIGNHDVLRSLAEKFSVPFFHAGSANCPREAHEAEILRRLELFQPELLVLAKYMRVLSPAFVARWPDRILNIHHSFLPAFAGAKPYDQAFQRGVKVIGATAHFVIDQLDEGPIIVQQVIPVDHTHTPQDLAQAGRDVEQIVLSRALRLLLEDRVFLCGQRTIIFD